MGNDIQYPVDLGANFDTDEIRRLGKRFKKLDIDGSGALSKDEFLQITDLQQNPLVQRVIELFDTDGNGEVDFKEFIEGISQFGVKGDKESKLRFAFRVYDIDRDGYISNGELFAVLKMMVGNNLKDTQLQQIVDKTIINADKDGDGKISFEEFCAILNGQFPQNKMIKTNSTENSSKKLQDYTKNLLNTLREQQLKTNKCLNLIQPTVTITNSPLSNRLNKNENILKNINDDLKKKYLRSDFEKLKNQKTVSFNDYLLHSMSPRNIHQRRHSADRRTRSVSPNLYKSVKSNGKSVIKIRPPKSILKKNAYDTDTDDIMDDYENLKRFLANNDILTMKDLARTNRDTFIECLSKSRQKYLNHLYNDDSQLMNDSQEIRLNEARKRKASKKVQISETSDSESGTPLAHWKYLFDDGNDRFTSRNPITNLIRPKSEPCLSSTTVSHSNTKETSTIKTTKRTKLPKGKTILGYDWITDALENRNSSLAEKPDEYWAELMNFRKQNSDACIDDNYGDCSFFSSAGPNLNDDTENYRHKCIHSYTLNERLFAVPTYVNENGESICPVCKSSRREPTNYAPQFCKISIPQSKLLENYTVKPQKRSQYTREDTLSLSEHCVAGFQNANKNKTQAIGRSKTVDLKSATGSPSDYVKFTTADYKRIATNRDPTADIYNKGHAMRYELENHHQQRLRELTPKIKIK